MEGLKQAAQRLRQYKQPRRDYVYQNLAQQERQIRVCNIQPAPDDEAVQMSLRTISLIGNADNFKCVSYVWGDEKDKVEIQLNGSRHRVTTNLDHQLRRLRRDGVTDDLWIDALCINQKNRSERSQQVALMSRIFGDASQVFVCIDDATHCREDLILQNDSVRDTFTRLEAGCHLDELICFSDPASDTSKAFRSLLDATWFKRAWVVQERCVAKEAVLLFPWGRMTWTTFMRALENWDYHSRTCSTCCSSGLRPFEGELSRICYRILCYVKSIRVMAASLDDEEAFSQAITLFPHLAVKVRKDKVYAYLGLQPLNAKLPAPGPNYRMSTNRVFRDCTLWLLRKQESLQALCLEFPHDMSLSSWIVNFSANYQIEPNYGRMRLDFLRHYNAANGLKSVPKYISPGILRVEGAFLDRIESAADTAFAIDPPETHIACLGDWRAFARRGNFDGTSRTSATFDHDLSTLMLGGCIKREDGVVRKLESEDIAAWNREVSELISKGFVGTSPVMETHAAAVDGRRVFRTKQGFLGTGPTSLKRGDHIWIVKGGAAPFILRPLWPSRVLPRLPLHKLVGHCYLNDQKIMNGGAVPSSGLNQRCLLR